MILALLLAAIPPCPADLPRAQTLAPKTIADAAHLVVVVKATYKAYLFERGQAVRCFEIALSQQPRGHKERQGDLRLPEGVYRITEKTKGPFDASKNWVNAYLGTRWLRLSYPNANDADAGLKRGLIDTTAHAQIKEALANGKQPPKTTTLGGGIGIHGWIPADWDNAGDRDLTWGCVSMHKADLEALFDWAPVGTQVLISP